MSVDRVIEHFGLYNRTRKLVRIYTMESATLTAHVQKSDVEPDGLSSPERPQPWQMTRPPIWIRSLHGADYFGPMLNTIETNWCKHTHQHNANETQAKQTAVCTEMIRRQQTSFEDSCNTFTGMTVEHKKYNTQLHECLGIRSHA